MRSDQANRSTVQDNPQLILRHLLKIKQRREQRLRRLTMDLNRKQGEIQIKINQNQCRRAELLAALEEKIKWSGTGSRNELMGYKREMELLFREERQQVIGRQTLNNDLKQVQTYQEEVKTELNLIMKKQEKLRILLEDDTYQN